MPPDADDAGAPVIAMVDAAPRPGPCIIARIVNLSVKGTDTIAVAAVGSGHGITQTFTVALVDPPRTAGTLVRIDKTTTTFSFAIAVGTVAASPNPTVRFCP